MKISTLLVLLFAVMFSKIDSFEMDGCLCKIGSTPRRDFDGTIKCWQDDVYNITECMTKAPGCRCSDPTAEVLESDDEVVCSNLGIKNTVKRWPCENKDEWILYLSAKKNHDIKQKEARVSRENRN
ncbi:unnamed protein product [Phyllotreta striolata]|uniref:Uncharacterized protein n=1 Tax=Phyllotreta striolata TaxID=444603 RepID=A0A9P0DXU1_PHYSR|nr:unnamed protein product [Phyllotreta striolata]